MPTKIYDIHYVYTIFKEEIEISPLKIKYMRQFMDHFNLVKSSQSEEETLSILVECATIAMKQFCPKIKTSEDFEESFDIKTMYKIIEYAGGIKMDPEDVLKEQIEQEKEAPTSRTTWDELDLNRLESEAFVLGIWKNYEELESSICLAELLAILEQKRESDYQDKKFTASLKGIDLDSASTSVEEDPWEAMKARVDAKLSGIGNGNPNDITALQGSRAQEVGFGIGLGLDYEVQNS